MHTINLRQVASLSALENDFCKKKKKKKNLIELTDLHGMLVFSSVKISMNGVFIRD